MIKQTYIIKAKKTSLKSRIPERLHDDGKCSSIGRMLS